MSDLRVHQAVPEPGHDARQGVGTWGKTYRYLRVTMVALLVALGAAVLHQTWRQDFHILSSVSAYYYTPAQAIFVGALIGLGACMIALRGTTNAEEVFLNIGGMFAAVVAIVPTARDADFRAAVRACRESGDQALTGMTDGLTCPSVRALEAAARANVENNMVSLLVVGLLGLIATLLFRLRDGRPAGTSAATFWSGFGVAVVVYGLGLGGFAASPTWFSDHAHYLAAIGLFICIFVVAVQNALRQRREQRTTAAAAPPDSAGAVPTAQGRRNHYGWIACLMVGAAVLGMGLFALKVVTLFWLEIVVALLFAVFWLAQTVEQGDSEPSQ